MLGALLIAAAALKLYGLSVSAVPPVGWFGRPRVQLVVVEWEIALGLWLISGAAPRAAGAAALGTFTAFAGVSGYLGSVGVASCGCFGVIHASPWWAFGVDVAAVTLLAVTRPLRSCDLTKVSTQPAVWVAISSAGTLAVLFAIGTFYYGSAETTIARLRGDLLVVDGESVDFGPGVPGQSLTAQIRIRNWSDRSVRLVGGTSDCSCMTTNQLPRVVPPGDVCELTVTLKVPPSDPGLYERHAELWTDDPRTGRVRFRAICLVRPPDHP